MASQACGVRIPPAVAVYVRERRTTCTIRHSSSSRWPANGTRLATTWRRGARRVAPSPAPIASHARFPDRRTGVRIEVSIAGRRDENDSATVTSCAALRARSRTQPWKASAAAISALHQAIRRSWRWHVLGAQLIAWSAQRTDCEERTGTVRNRRIARRQVPRDMSRSSAQLAQLPR